MLVPHLRSVCPQPVSKNRSIMFVEASLTMIRVLMPYHCAVVGFSFVEPNPRRLLSYFGIIEFFKPNPSIMLAQN